MTAEVFVNAGHDIDEQALATQLLPAIRAFARRRCSSPQEVDDFCQDALVRVLGLVAMERLREPEQIGSYALGVCKRVYSERLRRERRRKKLWEKWGPLAESTVAGPVEFDGVSIRLEGCLTALTQRAREVIRRTWFLDQTGTEIGSALKMTSSSVRVTRHRALATLRECMETGGLVGHD